MKSKWDEFYKEVGGKYICSECGAILTWTQKDLAGGVSVKGWGIAFLISLILTPFIGAIYLLSFAPKRGCPICHMKQEELYPINSNKGLEIFKRKHPDYAYLANDLVVGD